MAVRTAAFLPDLLYSVPPSALAHDKHRSMLMDGGLSADHGCTTANRIVEAARRMADPTAVSLQAALAILQHNDIQVRA